MNRFCMWVIVFGAMLFFIPWIGDPYMTPRLLFVALGAAPLLFRVSNRRSSLEVPMLGLLLAATVSAAFAQDRGYAMFGAYQFPADSLLAIAVYLCVLLAGARSGMDARGITRIIVYLSIPMSAYAIFQRFWTDPLLYEALPTGVRVVSTQGGPVFLGAVLAISAICALYLAKQRERLGWAALAFILPAMWFTLTRGALVATAVGGAFIFRSAPLLILPALVFLPRFISVAADSARIEVWKIALRVFMDNPVIGYGTGNFYIAFRRYVSWRYHDIMDNAIAVQAHAHNDILHVLATMGIVGLAAYLVLAASCVRVARESRDRPLLLGILAAYFVLSNFNPVTTSVFVMLALIFGAASAKTEPVASRSILPELACLAVAFFTAQLTWASYHFARGAAAYRRDVMASAYHFNRAAQLNPWEMVYTCRQVDSLVDLIPISSSDSVKPLAGTARELASRALRRHPMDSYAHELYGKTILVAHMAGTKVDPREAMAEFNSAQGLAPTFEALMWRRRKTAEALGDEDQIEFADKDIADLRATLAPGGI